LRYYNTLEVKVRGFPAAYSFVIWLNGLSVGSEYL
jgi:hypothetical protein